MLEEVEIFFLYDLFVVKIFDTKIKDLHLKKIAIPSNIRHKLR